VKLFQVVLKDISSRKKRLFYAALGVAVGTMTIIGILTVADAGQQRIYDQLDKYGPNILVTPAITSLDMQMGNMNLGTVAVGDNYIEESKLPAIKKTGNDILAPLNAHSSSDLVTLAPKLYVNTEINSTKIVAVGIDSRYEMSVKLWWEVSRGSYIFNPHDALVGSMVSELLGINPGDAINLNGTGFTVSGILASTGSDDDYRVFVPLGTLQQAFDKEGLISSVDVRGCCTTCPIEEVADGINSAVPGIRAVAIKQVAASEMGMMEKVSSTMLSLSGITLAVGLFGVANTMLASVNERLKDIGIMRAVGASRRQIVKIFTYEALAIGILGGLLGYVAGNLLAFALGPFIFEGIEIAFIPVYLPLSVGIATLISVIATGYPAFRATKFKVADSFRSL